MSLVVLDGIDTMMFVSQMSDIESYLVKVDKGVSLELTAAGQLLLNGPDFGGVVKVGKLVGKLNSLETAVNVLKTQMATHGHLLITPTGAPFPAAVAAPLPALVTNPLVPTLSTELENPNVQHG